MYNLDKFVSCTHDQCDSNKFHIHVNSATRINLSVVHMTSTIRINCSHIHVNSAIRLYLVIIHVSMMELGQVCDTRVLCRCVARTDL